MWYNRVLRAHYFRSIDCYAWNRVQCSEDEIWHIEWWKVDSNKIHCLMTTLQPPPNARRINATIWRWHHFMHNGMLLRQAIHPNTARAVLQSWVAKTDWLHKRRHRVIKKQDACGQYCFVEVRTWITTDGTRSYGSINPILAYKSQWKNSYTHEQWHRDSNKCHYNQKSILNLAQNKSTQTTEHKAKFGIHSTFAERLRWWSGGRGFKPDTKFVFFKLKNFLWKLHSFPL